MGSSWLHLATLFCDSRTYGDSNGLKMTQRVKALKPASDAGIAEYVQCFQC